MRFSDGEEHRMPVAKRTALCYNLARKGHTIWMRKRYLI